MGANMKTTSSRFISFGLLIAGLLVACSGGNINISTEGPGAPRIPPAPPPTNSEAITAHGVISGLNDVTVNGVRYSAGGATVTMNGQPGTLSDLRRGQIVTVGGRINGDGVTGSADSIRFDANLIGPVQSLNSAASRLIVMGQTIVTGPETTFTAGIDPFTYAGLFVGDKIQVSGFADSAGNIVATRIDTAGSGLELQLIGQVGGLDLANLLFTIGRLTLDYSSALLIDLPAGAPANGMMIKAIGTLSNGLFTVERLSSAPRPAGSSGQRIQAAGLITRFNSPADFAVGELRVAVGSAITYANGTAGDLGLNADVIIDGDFASGGRVTANRITFGHTVDETATLVFDFSNFTEISFPTVFNAIVSHGPDFSVEVIVDAEAASRIDVTQTGSRLTFALAGGDGHIDTLDAIVTLPVLDRIDTSGVVNVTLSGFDQSQMTVNVGGVSRIHGSALSIDYLTASVSGVSQLAFGDVRPIGRANINVGGVSMATLNMDVGSTLTGSVSTGQGTGVSTLYYYGTNVDVNVATSFPSTVVKLGETRP